ncbi:MAG: ATP-binding cassette domain-containing protein [Paraburkholderia sp.]|jgi:putative ABC transport system ATP-binding protein|uniref:ABC transporter related n=3 Tax=Burkholderiales TaxID=80840 RepID=B2SZE6_PARPJ|nr:MULTISPECIES: ATP-binding cassette domain-containing protein [Burkholderiaceae]UTP22194.1 ATP-binding cassette domain-containing protein [Burkholderia sp. FXe9]ACD14525.1 ABC transporter related [Paraburkholderia phytofirmans PsJN]MCA8371459.1 ATP-binding cassette domain-containing protein [Burkholderia contaminans]MDO5923139.1 ATP-binding cassette domain-containing protein [Burkholderia cenocepacia]MDP9549516.1 putative ABC transport system ATP-binding protein [Burkholderia cepacia]
MPDQLKGRRSARVTMMREKDTSLLSVERVSKTFHAGTVDERVALTDVSLKLLPGDFAVVVGGNGAGKSTFLNMLAGEVISDTGVISIDGRVITTLPTHRRAKYISRVFQDPSIGTAAALSLEENLAVANQRGLARGFGRGLTHAQAEAFRERIASFGLGLEKRMKAQASLLSGGQRQALSLLMAVLQRPMLLLLDEHTAALDPRTAEIVMRVTEQVVREAQLTTLMVTHNMHHAIDYGNRLIMMRDGRIVGDLTGEAKRAMTMERLMATFNDEPPMAQTVNA